MTTLVTGATGHIGNNLVRALLARQERVRVLCRPDSSPKPLAGLDVERVEGDLRDEGSLERALDGVERVYHVAAMISIRNGDRDALWDVNVAGTARLLAAARQAGVKRVVHTSSFGAMGRNPEGPSSEEHALDPDEPVMDYERSKAEAEAEVQREIARGLDACIVNPCATVGPFDFSPEPRRSHVRGFRAARQDESLPARRVRLGADARRDRRSPAGHGQRGPGRALPTLGRSRVACAFRSRTGSPILPTPVVQRPRWRTFAAAMSSCWRSRCPKISSKPAFSPINIRVSTNTRSGF